MRAGDNKLVSRTRSRVPTLVSPCYRCRLCKAFEGYFDGILAGLDVTLSRFPAGNLLVAEMFLSPPLRPLFMLGSGWFLTFVFLVTLKGGRGFVFISRLRAE
jgi:hypothetical protein